MKTKVLFLALLFISFASVSFAQRLTAKTKYQIARIEEALTSQLLNNADASAASQAYLPSAQTMRVQNGAMVTQNAAEPILVSTKATDYQQPGRIIYIDLQGTAAVARVERESSKGHVVDFVSLLQIDGEWKVVNQVRSYAESPALSVK